MSLYHGCGMTGSKAVPKSLVFGGGLMGILVVGGATCGAILLARQFTGSPPEISRPPEGVAEQTAYPVVKKVAKADLDNPKPAAPKAPATRDFTVEVHRELVAAWVSNPEAAAEKYKDTRFRAVGRVLMQGQYGDWVQMGPVSPSAFWADVFEVPSKEDRLKLARGKHYLIEFNVKSYIQNTAYKAVYENTVVVKEVSKPEPGPKK